MRTLLAILLLSISSSVLAAQEGPSGRVATVTSGVGNAMGWFGVQGSVRSRAVGSASSVGSATPRRSTRATRRGSPLAAGVRGYTPGVRHRGFVEVSVSQLEVQLACFDACERRYGPGVQLGYQYTARGGFTLMASGGVGRSLGNEGGTAAMLGFGVGWTWGR
jgi:hypothetical protein